jgi:hypothetical protein
VSASVLLSIIWLGFIAVILAITLVIVLIGFAKWLWGILVR